MKRSFLIVFALGLSLSLLAPAAEKDRKKPQPARMTGFLKYLQRIALSDGANVSVQLKDVTQPGSPALVAESNFVLHGEQVPLPFTLEYDKKKIDPERSYALEARIEEAGQLHWITHNPIPVLTKGNPSDKLDILLQQVSTSD